MYRQFEKSQYKKKYILKKNSFFFQKNTGKCAKVKNARNNTIMHSMIILISKYSSFNNNYRHNKNSGGK